MDKRIELARRFRKQEEFATDYSPLYALIFAILAEWSENEAPNLVVDWLVKVANGRSSFEVVLLLMAGIHRDVLADVPEMANLAQYYPTVGGHVPDEKNLLANALRYGILARQEELTHFIQTFTVQTNETGRGLVWTFPLLFTAWEAVHLVDLGASAGLNLVAERRAYRLLGKNGRVQMDVGLGNPIQFVTNFDGEIGARPKHQFPTILSRIGCDLNPFLLETKADELTLSAFIWGDQVERFHRLQEGILVFKEVSADTAVSIYKANLPHELPRFLQEAIATEVTAPVIIYNSYMTVYLEDQGRALHDYIRQWALTQNHPVLWLQWEPLWDGPEPPFFGWCGWTADLWQPNNKYDHFQFGWVHPHGTAVTWTEGFTAWEKLFA